MQDRVFYSVCFGFIFGVLWRSFLFVNFFFVLTLLLISSALFLYFTLVKFKWGVVGAVCLLAFSLGILRFNMADIGAPKVFEAQIDQKISLSGKIIDEPTIGENNQQIMVEAAPQGITLESLKAKPFPAARILISTNLDVDYKYGDEINFTGELEKPENFTTDQGKEFDYVNYLRKDGILFVMNYPKIEIISQGNGNKLKSVLFSIKEKFLEKINFSIQDPESLLMSGLILGEKSAFSQSLRQSFIDTGTIHIVALSGYNVTIVAEWFMKLFAFLPKNLGIGAGILIIFLFIVMTGGSTTAIRAGIMAVLVLVARATGRNYDVARALILAGVFMILLNPFILAYDVSFQLSFIATIAVIFLTPRIEKYFLWITTRFELRDIISVTCAAYIFVLPFVIYKMGNLSMVAFPANILILPFIPFTMGLGFLTGFVGLINYFLAGPFGYVSYLFLHYELWIISFFSRLPFASFIIPNFPLFAVILIYLYFIYRLFGRSIKNFFTEPL